MANVYKGTIKSFSGSWGSGIATLAFTNGVTVVCENAPTCRAFDNAFDGFIVGGHSVDVSAIVGEVIYYSLEDWGVLAGFTTADEASEEIKRAQINTQRRINRANKGTEAILR